MSAEISANLPVDEVRPGQAGDDVVGVPSAAASVVRPTFEQFYSAERDRIARAVALSLGDMELGVEATDEAFARAFERWPSISSGNTAGWIYRVAMNWALSTIRRRRRSRQAPLYQADQFHDPDPGEPAVRAALAALDPRHRSVVVCRHLLGWSVVETARALHLREGTVKSRLARANRTLQTQLHHLSPEEQR